MCRKEKGRMYDYWLNSVNSHEDLKSKSITGGINTMASQIICFGLNLTSTVILAHILLPSDFGLVGMVTAFTGFVSMIKDMGLSEAVIQKEEITHHQVSNLFWFNLLICLVITVVLITFSPLIVSFYNNDTQLYPILFSYSAGIMISGFATQHAALMNRKMLFGLLTKANVFACGLSVICGIVAALIGLGYWAIIVLNISQIVFFTCLMWIFCRWRPALPSKKYSIKHFLSFGIGIFGFNMVSYFSDNSDNMIIGRQIGPSAVGFYSKAYGLLMLPIIQIKAPLTKVAIPAMSKLQNMKIKYISYYKKYVFIVAFFSMPLIASLAIFSKEIIYIVLGKQWMPSSPIFQLLAIAGFILPVAGSSSLVMVSTGQTKKYFIIGCFTSIIVVLGFLIGIRWGVMGITVSFVATTYITLIPTLLYAFKDTPIKISMFLNEIILPVIHTFLMCIILILLKLYLNNVLPSFIILILVVPIGLAFYYFSWKLYPVARKKFMNIQELIEIALNAPRSRNILLFKKVGKKNTLNSLYKNEK